MLAGRSHLRTNIFPFGEQSDCPSLRASNEVLPRARVLQAQGIVWLLPVLLLNAGLALLPPHILHDLINIRRSNSIDLRHVAEFPVVRLDAIGCRPFEGLIPVMVRFVDLMHQWWSMVGSRRLLSVAGRTVCVEHGFARLEFSRHRAACDCRLGGLRGIAGRKETHTQQPRSDLNC
jgi:hypothetical protein